ncbi:MAG: sulfatase, partial [Planctomycetaceae bacterium]
MRLFCLCLLGLLSPLAAADRPNIILMMADDQGWNGTSVAMHPDIPGSRGEIWHTPNLERLAAQGMRFSAGYSPAP